MLVKIIICEKELKELLKGLKIVAKDPEFSIFFDENNKKVIIVLYKNIYNLIEFDLEKEKNELINYLLFVSDIFKPSKKAIEFFRKNKLI